MFSIRHLIVALIAALGMRAAFAQTTRPNILLLISDDQSWRHTGYMGDPAIKTPTLDRIAHEGMIFEEAHCMSSSCTPSRGALLTGLPIWELEQGANLWSTLPAKLRTYPELLSDAGYFVGSAGKGWAPGDFRPGGRTQNPAGKQYKSFDAFLAQLPPDRPFCFWFGSHHPHRPYVPGSGIAAGVDASKVNVPPMLPDVPEVRSDVATYLNEIQKFDAESAKIIAALQKSGRLENTLIVATSDNGMPFPRGKSTLYEYGTHEPMAARWPGHIKPGRKVDDLISLMDLGPTFLDAAGVKPPPGTMGRSLVPLMESDQSGQIDPTRNRIFVGNERHANSRAGNVGFPRRGIRTEDFLYLHNYIPDRWPAGDPPKYGDVDPADGSTGEGLSKDFILAHQDDPKYKAFFVADFGKMPAEELYDVKADPNDQHNLADDPKYAKIKQSLRQELDQYLLATHDPRSSTTQPAPFDGYPYYGGPGPYGRKKSNLSQ